MIVTAINVIIEDLGDWKKVDVVIKNDTTYQILIKRVARREGRKGTEVIALGVTEDRLEIVFLGVIDGPIYILRNDRGLVWEARRRAGAWANDQIQKNSS